jgi:hypothetical protein
MKQGFTTIKEQRAVEVQTTLVVKPLTDAQVRQVTEFLNQSQAIRDRIRKRRKGKPLPSSWRLIRQAREERSRQL